MKKYFLVLAMLGGLVTAQAAPPSDQSIEQMLNAVHVQAMLDQMMTQMDAGMQQGMQQALKGKAPTPAQRAKMEEFQKKISALMKEELSFAKTKDIYLQVYRETFTQEEVNSIIAFYSSPAGKAMVEKLPVAMQKAGALMQARMGPMMEKLQGMMETFQKDMEKTK
ncbi:MAG: DUF2059 domain-containing protein [Verrucomicrobiota bacterium]|nr:DUF2059 domain-containing protein [Verrucomicrobiota bacterium]